MRRVSRIVIFVTAVVLAVGAGAQAGLIDGLGTAASPFVGEWELKARGWGLLVAAAVCGAAVAITPKLVRARLHPALVALALYLLAVGLGLALNVVRDGTGGWTRMFDLGPPPASFEGPNEYLAGLPALSYGTWFFLDRFADLVPSLPAHVAGHPPGGLLLLHLLRIDTAGGFAALCVLAGSACTPLTYRLGWTLADERTGRVAGLLCACTPLTLLFGVSSYDSVFAAATAAAVCCLVAAGWGWRMLGALLLALAALMNWALLGAGAWAVVVVWRRDGWRPATVLAAACGAAIVAVNGALALRYGYDPIATLRVTEQIYRDSVAQFRPYWFWVLGSAVAWGVTLGPAIVAPALRALVARTPAAIALAVVVTVATVGGFTKAETERIWLFLVPLACAAAAPFVDARRMRLVLATLLAQALAMQVLVDTVW
ncbi:MAG: hypothetical protein JHC95_00625 [Solirubrobacteraceae bacterium]|nr:hypothetical protein [Solirubrobacteraceae bacterium]